MDALTLDDRIDLLDGDDPPRFRGVLHLIAFFAAAPVGVLIVLHARTGIAELGAAVYAGSVAAMLGGRSPCRRSSS